MNDNEYPLIRAVEEALILLKNDVSDDTLVYDTVYIDYLAKKIKLHKEVLSGMSSKDMVTVGSVVEIKDIKSNKIHTFDLTINSLIKKPINDYNYLAALLINKIVGEEVLLSTGDGSKETVFQILSISKKQSFSRK